MPSQRGWFFGRKDAQDPGAEPVARPFPASAALDQVAAAGEASGPMLESPSNQEPVLHGPPSHPGYPAALQPASSGAAAPGHTILRDIPLDHVSANPYQPRTAGEPDESLAELAESIKSHGLLQPILVARQGESYVLVAGERRWRAAALAGLATLPALVGDFGPREMAESALIENLQRRDLNCLEEAEAFRRLLEEFGLTQEELAGRLGRSQPAVANKLRLLRLPEPIRESISRGIVSEGHARALLGLASAELQGLALGEIVHRALSVRQTEELVRGMAGHPAPPRNKGRRQVVRVFKDARLFRNSLLSLVSQMKRGGAVVRLEETAGSDYYEVHLKVERRPEGKEKPAGASASGARAPGAGPAEGTGGGAGDQRTGRTGD